MKVPILKALANPARIFFVPYNLAVLNLVILLFIHITIFVTVLILSGGKVAVNPLYFMLVLITTHSILAVWSKKEPFLAKIIASKINLFKHKIPKKLFV